MKGCENRKSSLSFAARWGLACSVAPRKWTADEGRFFCQPKHIDKAISVEMPKRTKSDRCQPREVGFRFKGLGDIKIVQKEMPSCFPKETPDHVISGSATGKILSLHIPIAHPTALFGSRVPLPPTPILWQEFYLKASPERWFLHPYRLVFRSLITETRMHSRWMDGSFG